ncbi:MAG: transposase [Bacteroidota bacterium]
MRIRKLTGREPKVKSPQARGYDYYVAVDWSERTMAIAIMAADEALPRTWEGDSDVARLQAMVGELAGRVMLTFEESTGAHWLYGKLLPSVDRLIVCNPGYNRLLCRGPKNDTIDATKLCLLLRQGSLKEVYHSTSSLYELRQLVSAYEDTVRTGVIAQNQLKACGRGRMTGRSGTMITEQLKGRIEQYRREKRQFEEAFARWAKRIPVLRQLKRLPGIGLRGAVKILGYVLDARRFPNRGHYWSYCGLVWHHKMSGGRRYGRRRPQYNHQLKAVYKTAALVAIKGSGPVADYYQNLVAQGRAEHNARHAVARYLARLSYGILKQGVQHNNS